MLHFKKKITGICTLMALAFVTVMAASCGEGGGGGDGLGGGSGPGAMGGIGSAGISSSPVMAAALQNANALNQNPQFQMAQADVKELEDAGVLADGDKDALQPLAK